MGFCFDFQGKVFGPVDNGAPLFCIAGPCALEGRAHALEVAAALREIFAAAGVPFLYKSSFDKAKLFFRRLVSRRGHGPGLVHSGRGAGERGRARLTDVHTPEQAAPVAEVADMLQTPALLCRQTDLITAVAATGKPVNIKKGQFLAPREMANVLHKARATGNERICLCERGTSFGYGSLVVDMRGLEIMKRSGAPVIFDATHSVQLPGALGDRSGGQREFVLVLARAAVAVGVAGLFMEVHPDPDKAPCDGPNMLALRDLPPLLNQLCAFDRLAKGITGAEA